MQDKVAARRGNRITLLSDREAQREAARRMNDEKTDEVPLAVLRGKRLLREETQPHIRRPRDSHTQRNGLHYLFQNNVIKQSEVTSFPLSF